MITLLTKSRLDTMRRALYGSNVKAVFYRATPAAGETEIASITSGFHMVREKKAGRDIDGSGVKMWLAAGMVERSSLKIGAVCALTINGVTTRYSVGDLLPGQQIGSAFVLRLKPLTGAAG